MVTVDQVPHYRFLGTIVAFKPKEQYGFLHSEQMVTNVLFGANNCSAAVRGMKGWMVGNAVGFTVKLKSKLVLGARGVEVVEEGWSPERLEGRVLEWRREECLLIITKSPSQPSLLGARVWCAGVVRGRYVRSCRPQVGQAGPAWTPPPSPPCLTGSCGSGSPPWCTSPSVAAW